MTEFVVVTASHVPGLKKYPAWMRSSLITSDLQVFVPACVGECGETIAFLCAGYDGTPAITYKKHLFLPCEWISKEYPFTKEYCDKVKSKCIALCDEIGFENIGKGEYSISQKKFRGEANAE